jgi:hypothetical protein
MPVYFMDSHTKIRTTIAVIGIDVSRKKLDKFSLK